MRTTSIIIADDHPIFLKGLREVIEADRGLQVLFAAANGEEAVEAVRTRQPDVVVLDIDMPKMNGLAAAQEILALRPEVSVILLTMHKAKDAFLKSLEIGVMGYVLKENAVVEIIHAIQAVMLGHSYISPEMTACLLKQSYHRDTHPGMEQQLALLTPAELRILQMVGAYKTSREMADELSISEKTVSNHRMNIARKLNLTGKNSLLRFAIAALPADR